MSELKEDTIYLDSNVYIHANFYLSPSLTNDVSICRESQYDNQDDIDIDITREQAIKIVNLLQSHYKLEKGADK